MLQAELADDVAVPAAHILHLEKDVPRLGLTSLPKAALLRGEAKVSECSPTPSFGRRGRHGLHKARKGTARDVVAWDLDQLRRLREGLAKEPREQPRDWVAHKHELRAPGVVERGRAHVVRQELFVRMSFVPIAEALQPQAAQ